MLYLPGATQRTWPSSRHIRWRRPTFQDSRSSFSGSYTCTAKCSQLGATMCCPAVRTTAIQWRPWQCDRQHNRPPKKMLWRVFLEAILLKWIETGSPLNRMKQLLSKSQHAHRLGQSLGATGCAIRLSIVGAPYKFCAQRSPNRGHSFWSTPWLLTYR